MKHTSSRRGLGHRIVPIVLGVVFLSLTIFDARPAAAGSRRARRAAEAEARRQRLVATQAVVSSDAPYPMLGTYYPGNYMMVRSGDVAGGGYAPLHSPGETSMTIYGPFAATRSISAPVRLRATAYTGETVEYQGVGSSSPYLPSQSPIVYPTQATYYYGFRESYPPPAWKNGSNWVDLN